MLKKWLGDHVFWQNALRLALPVALQNLLMSSFTLVDTIMVGQLGESALAAVGMAGQMSFLLNLFLFGFCSGSSVFISQFWGVHDRRGIHRSFGLLLVNTTAISIVFLAAGCCAPKLFLRMFTSDAEVIRLGADYLRIAAFSYIAMALSFSASTVLRATEEVRLPLYASAVSVIVNAAFNYILIFGKLGLPEMGVAGAAAATVISSFINPMLLYAVSKKKKNILIARFQELFGYSKAFVAKFYKLSMPVVANESLWALGTMGYNMVFGHMGTGNYSALTVFRTVEGLAFVFFVGLCHACTVMVGKNIGAGYIKDAIADARRFIVLVPLLSLLVGLSIIMLRAPLMSLFNLTEEVRSTAMSIIIIYGLEIAMRNIPYISIVGVFRAGGDTRTGMIYDICCVWLIALPLTVFLGLIVRLPFLWVYAIMLLSEDLVKNILCLKRFFSLKWIQPVTEQGMRAAQDELSGL